MNYYFAYELIFASELEIPELTPLRDTPIAEEVDVHIRFGEVPEEVIDPLAAGVMFQANADQFLLDLHGIASYLVSHASEIVIQPKPDSINSDVRVFLLGSVFGALLHQRQTLVLHAAAIHTDSGAVLIAGPSGIGKSSLLGEFLRRGYPMMVDDVCAVVSQCNQPTVLPGYPRTRLWADSAGKLDVATENLPRTRPSMEKFERQVGEQFWDKPSALKQLYLLSSHNADNFALETMPAMNTFEAVLQNTYRNAFLDGLNMRKTHFQLVSDVATSINVTKVVRPHSGFRLVELADQIESHFRAA